MPVIPVSSNAKSMWGAISLGRLQPGAAHTHTENVASCRKQYAIRKIEHPFWVIKLQLNYAKCVFGA